MSLIPDDTIPPVVHYCPGDITALAIPGLATHAVSCSQPTATDSSEIFNLTSNFASASQFPAGSFTTVIYTAIDNAGNSDTSCRFNVFVTV